MAARGIRRVIELAIDAASARRMQKDAQEALRRGTDPSGAQRNLTLIGRGMEGLGAGAVKLGKVIGTALGALGMGGAAFLAGSLRAFQDADKVWNRLAGTLETVGVRYASVKREIQGAAAELTRRSTVDDEGFAQILTTLVSISGDYAKSLRNVTVVADLAAAKQMDIETAANLVGKAMVGQTWTLKRYGIVIGETDDAVEVMRQRFAGLAENELQTTAGRIQQLNNFWADFREAVGEAVATTPAVTDFLDRLSSGAFEASSRFGDLTTVIGSFIDTLLGFGRVKNELGGWFGSSTKGGLLNAGPAEFAAAFGRVQEQNARVRQGIQELQGQSPMQLMESRRALEARRQTVLQDGIRWASDARAATAELQDIKRLIDAADAALRSTRRRGSAPRPTPATATSGRRRPSRTTAPRLSADEDRGAAYGASAGAAPAMVPTDWVDPRIQAAEDRIRAEEEAAAAEKALGEERIAALQEQADREVAIHREAMEEKISFAQSTAESIMHYTAEMFAMTIRDGASAADALDTFLKNVAVSNLMELGRYAGGKAIKEIGLAISDKAQAASYAALTPTNPAYAIVAAGLMKSSASHLTAAAWWAAKGAAAGAGAAAVGSIGGGSGGSGGGRGSSGFDDRSSDNVKRSGPEIHIYVDGIDPQNPKHQDLAGAAVQQARERWGDQRINIHPRTSA